MTSPVRFENVSKRYQIGLGNTSLRETLAAGLTRIRRRTNGSIRKAQTRMVLNDISMAVDTGEVLGIIGPNGAGKSTILKMVAGVTRPTSGLVTVNGRIGALIELGAGFHPDLTGRDNIYLNAAILGMSRREVDRLFVEIVEFAGLGAYIDTPVKRYSSGMYLRLGFSVAVHSEPEVLLVDEVLAVGDSEFRKKCSRRIQELKRDGKTILFVSHNLYLVASVCDRVIFLLDGTIKAEGRATTVIGEYESWLHNAQTQSPEALLGGGASTIHLPTASSIQITDVNVVNPRPGNGSGFQHGDPCEIRVAWTAQEPVTDPKLVARIVRDDGTTCCMIRSNDHGISMDELYGTGTISMTLDPIQLAGGAYTIQAILMGPIDGNPLALGHSGWFTVKGPSFGHEEASGVYVPHVSEVRVENGHNGRYD